MDYKDTLNLPFTQFAMKANLPEREPVQLTHWENNCIYNKIIEKSKTKPTFILHDGPPYANGHLHIGHAINKILKDIIVRSKQMTGYNAQYVPGWDCHGLPIEHNVDKKLGSGKKEMTPVQIRQECRNYARSFVDIQRDEFKRFGVGGDWDNPYLTMNNDYEARIAKECGEFALQGDMFLGEKPIYWCCSCQTALAEAEIEYHDQTSPSIYVKFLVTDDLARLIPDMAGKPVFIVIWTTTPWTIPANLGITLHPDYTYSAVDAGDHGILILAKDLVRQAMEAMGISDYTEVAEIDARDLEKKSCAHPLYDRSSLIMLGEHVTLDAGTGCVHTAPGHGADDHIVGGRYGLTCYSPVEDNGVFSDSVALFSGQFIFKANAGIIDTLDTHNALLKHDTVNHSYPHCWRCKKPVIYRATPQWFISMDKQGLRKKSLEQINQVEWIPSWGKERIYSMIEHRPDWCLSRQRSWGVPIPVFHCKTCKHVYVTRESVDRIYDLFKAHSSDIWFEKPAEYLMPKDAVCENCKGTAFDKDHNILDVWFDSGVSHAAVLEEREAFSRPADLYLEGSDQHRGWFHSSLLTCVGRTGRAPYRAVLTHGFVVDEQGRKMSKSVGNVVAPETVIKRYGADVLRLWVASADYRGDVSISDNILRQLSDAYRRIRNTCRFILGNLTGFDPDTQARPYETMQELDQFILHRLFQVTVKCIRAYQDYEYHTIYHSLHNFCTVDLSSFYLDIIKDRLYTLPKEDDRRKDAQTVIFRILDSIVRIMTPILPFTADEIWNHMPEFRGKEENVQLTSMAAAEDSHRNDTLAKKWETLRLVRAEVTRALEEARTAKLIGHSLDASVEIKIETPELKTVVNSLNAQLDDLFIVSKAAVREELDGSVFKSKEIEGLYIKVGKAPGRKCERCWRIDVSVLSDNRFPNACARCSESLERMA